MIRGKAFFGRIWSKIEKFKVSRIEIKTVNAVAGVKGTTFWMDVNEDTSSLVRYVSGVSVSESRGLGGRVATQRDLTK